MSSWTEVARERYTYDVVGEAELQCGWKEGAAGLLLLEPLRGEEPWLWWLDDRSRVGV